VLKSLKRPTENETYLKFGMGRFKPANYSWRCDGNLASGLNPDVRIDTLIRLRSDEDGLFVALCHIRSHT
jgi:hypothetical protein